MNKSIALLSVLLTCMLANVIMAAPPPTLTSTACSIVGDIRSIIGILALAMFIVGAIIYAIAHLLPAAGQIRGNTQGWGMGMVIGGIVGIVLVLLAPAIITLVLSLSPAVSAAATPLC